MIENHRSGVVRLAALFVFMIPLLSTPWADAQNAAERPPVKEWQKTLDEAEKDLAQPDVSDSRLEALRDQLPELRAKAQAAADAAAGRAEVLRSDLAALGPAPAAGAPP